MLINAVDDHISGVWLLFCVTRRTSHGCRVKCGMRGKSGSLKCREFVAGQKYGVTCKVRSAGRRSTSLVIM